MDMKGSWILIQASQVAALKDYKEKFPGLFEALRTRKEEKKDSGDFFLHCF